MNGPKRSNSVWGSLLRDNVMSTYLRQEAHYNDLYDLGTIESCLSSLERWQQLINKNFNTDDLKKLSEEDRMKGFRYYANIELHTIKGERFRRRESIIRELMDCDRKRDERLKNAQEPRNIHCPDCSARMKVALKDLYDFTEDAPRVLFFFECEQCNKRKGIFDDGREFVSKRERCPKCDQVIKNGYKREDQIETWTKTCPSCGVIETEIEDLAKKDAEQRSGEAKDRELLEKYRAKFCLSSKEGEDYLDGVRRLEALSELIKKAELQKTDPDYQKVRGINRLSVVQLEKLISETLTKDRYVKLSLEKPIIDRHVIVPFTIQDADSSRKENDSERSLRKVLKKTLEGTNWRLMSEGVSYRLGYLSGRLKGYEQEEDLVEVVRSDGRTKEKDS
jgi:hypothetical protein